MTSPSEPPDPVTDCFPVMYCNEFGRGCTVQGNASPDDSVDVQAVRGFLDVNGYFWIAITSYAWNSSGVPVPHWVTIYKSKDVVDCDAIRAADETGWSPVGALSTDWMELVCSGLAVGWDSGSTEGRCGDSDDPVADCAGAIPTLTFHRSRGGCCKVPNDPCNDPPEGTCGDTPGGEVICVYCSPDNVAPAYLQIELAFNFIVGTAPCDDLFATYIVPFFGCSSVTLEAGYYQEFTIEPPITIGGKDLVQLTFTIGLSSTTLGPDTVTTARVIVGFRYDGHGPENQIFGGTQPLPCVDIADLEAIDFSIGGVCAMKAYVTAVV